MASIDIVIPNYQYGRYLRHCVTSVLSQKIQQMRVLIIDNASTDDSLEVAQSIARDDPRVQVIARQRNLGWRASFNEGIDWATAEYFLVLCSDDFLLPNSLEHAINVLDANPNVVFAFGRDIQYVDRDPLPGRGTEIPRGPWRIITGMDYAKERCENPATTVAALVRTAAQKTIGYYRSVLFADLEMQLRLSCLGHVAAAEANIVVQRLHGLNRSAAYWSNFELWLTSVEDAFASFFENEGGALPVARELRKRVKSNLARRAYWSGLSHIARGDAPAGMHLINFALSRAPTLLILPPFLHLLQMDNATTRLRAILPEMMSLRRRRQER